MGVRIEKNDSELPHGVVRIVAGDSLAEIDLMMKFEDEIGLVGVGYEFVAAELLETGEEAVVRAEAISVFLIASIAKEDFVGGKNGGRERGLGWIGDLRRGER